MKRAILTIVLLLLAGAPAVGRAQSSPTISIVLSPGHMVPQNTAITATVALDNLNPANYSSLVFHADLTEWDPHFSMASAGCEGDEMGEDITVEVDVSRETFTVEVWKSCSADIYAHYTLDAALVRLDSSAPGGRVELASAETRFAMSRYLGPGETPPPPPGSGVAGWLDPAPGSFEWKVGEWVEFRTRTDVLQYLNHHVGVLGFGSPDGARFADIGDGLDAEEACRNVDDGRVNWRRAINQPAKFVACRAGEATIEVWHETEAERLSTYKFRIRPAVEDEVPEQQHPDLVVESPSAGGGGGGGGGGTAPQSGTVGSTGAATATEIPGDKLRLDIHGQPENSFELGIGWVSKDGSQVILVGVIRDQTLGQTYLIVRHEGFPHIVRRWVPPYSPLIYAIDWPLVIARFSFPVEVISAIPLDHRHPEPNMLARRFDGADIRIFAYDAVLEQWRHIPDYSTFQTMGFYWCDVTAADSGFFERISTGSPFPSSNTPLQTDYPNCSTG